MPSLRDEIGDFVGVPFSFIEDEQQTAESRVVFMILRYHTNRRRKRSFPGYETIMRETGLSRQKTASGIAVLVKTGWLVKHRQFGRSMEYEIRFPDPHDSSTRELSQEPTIVPTLNDDGSAGELRSNSDNKIEFNKIKIPRAYREKLKTPEVKTTNPPKDFSVTEGMYLWMAEMCFAMSDQEIAEATNAWRESRESKPNHFGRTLMMWQSDWKKFIRIYWNFRQERKNGNGNGKRYETASERNVRNIRESLEYADTGKLPARGHPPDNQSTALLPAAKSERGRNGDSDRGMD